MSSLASFLSRCRGVFISVVLAWSGVTLAGAAPVESLDLDGVEVHPTRILARIHPSKKTLADNQVSTLGLRARPLGVPGLVVLDEAPDTGGVVPKVTPGAPVAAGAGGVASPTTPQDPAARLLRLKQRLAALRASGLYAYVEADPIQRTFALPTDSAFVDGTLWGLRNLGLSGGVAGADINVVPAWDITEGSAAVVVGVIDTGIRYSHQDLAARMWRNPGESGAGRETNGVDDDGDGYVDNVFGINAITNSGNPFDDNDHGTHCAGTIGATPDNGHPHVGVARDVRLMALKFLDAEGSGATSDAIRCIDFAVAKGVRILSNSWGGGGYSQALFDSIAAARDAGVLFAAAAGNEANDNDAVDNYPSNYALDNIVAVAALDREDKLASFSNYGATTVHLGAPGVDIYSSVSGSDSAYASFSGTSMATPHVAGVAALLLARYPSLPVSQLRNRLLVTTPIAALAGRSTTGGRVDAFAALNATADGLLEFQVSSSSGGLLLGGQNVTFTVDVTDLEGVTDATVSGRLGAGAVVTLANDGVAPDLVAGDSRYTATFAVPASAGAVTFRVTASAPGKTTATRDFDFSVVLPPANDYFDDAALLAGLTPGATGSNLAASAESGEPSHARLPARRSVWWRWTAPAAGAVRIQTAGSAFDTVLAVYTGDNLAALTSIASNDDTASSLQSEVNFQSEAGVIYHIAVDGYNGAVGAITLALSSSAPSAPGNDDFASAEAFSGISRSLTGSNVSATSQPDEPVHAGVGGGRSVWWSWTPTQSGDATVHTLGSSFDTLLAVYTGDTLAALVPVAASDDDAGSIDGASLVSFPVVAGNTYRIAVDGKAGAQGTVLLATRIVAAAPPANDDFAARLPVALANFPVTGTNFGATRESGEPAHAGNPGGDSVWWTWTAPADGNYTLSTAGSDFDTLLAVYTGTALDSLTLVAANNDASSAADATSALVFTAVAGQAYHFAVDGANYGFGPDAGAVQLGLSAAPISGLANDFFDQATTLTGGNITASGSNVGSTAEPGEPTHVNQSPIRSVWWRWTAPAAGILDVNTEGSDFDTVLAVYTGPAVNALTLRGGDDDSGAGLTSLVSLPVVAGETYHIAVAGYSGGEGVISLQLSFTEGSGSPDNDDFADAPALTGLSGTTSGDNFGAGAEPGEPAHDGSTPIRSVWWVWTAPVTGTATFNTNGSGFDTVLAAYTGPTVDALSLLASDDDAGDGVNSLVQVPVTAGVVYRVAVAGFGGDEGDITLAWSMLSVAAPVITMSPTSFFVQHGENAVFQAQALNVLTWRWQSSGDGVNWGDLSDDLYHGGTDTSALTVLAPSYPSPVVHYRVRAMGPGGEDVSEAATLTVLDTLARYLSAHFSPAELASPSISGPQADADGDGLSNLLEYAFGSSPRLAAEALRAVHVVPPGGGLALRYARRLDAVGIGYAVEYSASLDASAWLTGPAYVEEIETAPLDATREWVTVRAVPTAGARHFLRLRVTIE